MLGISFFFFNGMAVPIKNLENKFVKGKSSGTQGHKP